MIKGNAVFQRTESGREEIRRKTHGLTQSERLVLILVDGIADIDAVRKKLKGVNDERYNRALKKLVRNNLVQEVLIPMAGQEAESVDDGVADLFLHQDALDPVTIISANPDDELDSTEPATVGSRSGAVSVTPAGTVDLHLWTSKTGGEADPFPVIRTESRIAPPADLKPLRESRPLRGNPSLTPPEGPVVAAKSIRPISEQPASKERVGPSRTPASSSQAYSQPAQKQGAVWIFWVILALLSILATGFLLFY